MLEHCTLFPKNCEAGHMSEKTVLHLINQLIDCKLTDLINQ